MIEATQADRTLDEREREIRDQDERLGGSLKVGRVLGPSPAGIDRDQTSDRAEHRFSVARAATRIPSICALIGEPPIVHVSVRRSRTSSHLWKLARPVNGMPGSDPDPLACRASAAESIYYGGTPS